MFEKVLTLVLVWFWKSSLGALARIFSTLVIPAMFWFKMWASGEPTKKLTWRQKSFDQSLSNFARANKTNKHFADDGQQAGCEGNLRLADIRDTCVCSPSSRVSTTQLVLSFLFNLISVKFEIQKKQKKSKLLCRHLRSGSSSFFCTQTLVWWMITWKRRIYDHQFRSISAFSLRNQNQ